MILNVSASVNVLAKYDAIFAYSLFDSTFIRKYSCRVKMSKHIQTKLLSAKKILDGINFFLAFFVSNWYTYCALANLECRKGDAAMK